MSSIPNNGLMHMPSLIAKRRIFVSYHHANDQAYYDVFSNHFHDTYDVIYDNSLERRIDSDNSEYVMRKIRENYITGTSCTVVLCGKETHLRKFVDWEIKATLDKDHGLIGVGLPTALTLNGHTVPDRFLDNYNSGFAAFVTWQQIFEPNMLQTLVHQAAGRSASLINNTRAIKARNS